MRYTQRIIQTVKSREADIFSRPDKFSHGVLEPRLSTGSDFIFIFNRFPRGHYLVWWVRVRVRVSLGVKVSVSVEVRVWVSNLLGSG